MKLTENFTLKELTDSATADKYGIKNDPDERSLKNLEKLVKTILQPIRDAYGKPVSVRSGYRCPKLNSVLPKASKTSQHMTGEAADIYVKDSKAELFHLIQQMMKDGKIKVGQLIWEYGTKAEPRWIHISLPRNNGKPNNQVLYYYD